jgi:hypothetical protein
MSSIVRVEEFVNSYERSRMLRGNRTKLDEIDLIREEERRGERGLESKGKE